jgi:hypothetical protein
MSVEGSEICEARYRECDRRMTGHEKRLCAIDKPEKGALAEMHEKMNGGFANRPTWKVFLIIAGCLFTLAIGSYGYTKSVADDQKNLVTKSDFKEFKEDILREISRSLNKGGG